MAGEQRTATHPHIGFGREPDVERQRRKRGGRGPNLPARNRAGHGEMIGTEMRSQRYSVAVRFWHSDTEVDLYQELRASVRTHTAVEIRARAVVW